MNLNHLKDFQEIYYIQRWNNIKEEKESHLLSLVGKFFPVDLAFDSSLSWSNFNLQWLEIVFYIFTASLNLWLKHQCVDCYTGLIMAMQQSNWCNPVKKNGDWNSQIPFIGFSRRKIVFISKNSYSYSLGFEKGS